MYKSLRCKRLCHVRIFYALTSKIKMNLLAILEQVKIFSSCCTSVYISTEKNLIILTVYKSWSYWHLVVAIKHLFKKQNCYDSGFSSSTYEGTDHESCRTFGHYCKFYSGIKFSLEKNVISLWLVWIWICVGVILSELLIYSGSAGVFLGNY